MRIMIVAGEASGELHGAGVVAALRARRPEIDILGIGGDRMEQAGCELVYHIERFSVMGHHRSPPAPALRSEGTAPPGRYSSNPGVPTC